LATGSWRGAVRSCTSFSCWSRAAVSLSE
jgi:hypothetical protein